MHVGHRARTALVQFTNTLKTSSLVGFFTGFCLQDLNIVASVIGSMSVLGALTTRKLIFIMASANIGALIFLYFIFLDIKILIVYMVGISGVLLYLEKPFYLRSLYENLILFLPDSIWGDVY
ncbi:MAG: hypothetical protein H0T62_10615 [Parachlamydiaceae bacterium]|nr:hypothetical protein [Parachlamydiaceae bacterium]